MKVNEKNILTGFYDLDNKINGLSKGDLIVIASRPNMGKSTLLFKIATNIASQEKSVVIFSLEMSKDYIVNKFKGLLNGKVHIDETPAITIEKIRKKCIALKQEQSLDIALVDYFQLVSTEKHIKDREQEISYISNKLKELAQELNIPVIITTQLSKDLEFRNDKRPVLSDLKNTTTLKQNADVILALYRDDYYKDTENTGEIEIILVKNKYGTINDKEQ